MNKMQQQVAEFHRMFGAPVADEPTLIPGTRWQLRHDLIHEELAEYWDAALDGDLAEIADALGDLLYVVFGAALEHGIDLEPVVDEIHRSNLSKLGEDGKPIYRADGKILKGDGYTPPSIEPVLAAQSKDLSARAEVKKGYFRDIKLPSDDPNVPEDLRGAVVRAVYEGGPYNDGDEWAYPTPFTGEAQHYYIKHNLVEVQA